MQESKENHQTANINVSTLKTGKDILYHVNERPPWYLCILLAFQQILTCFGGTFSYPLIISGAICIAGDSLGLSELISTIIFIGGLSSVLQTTFGIRLPIIQSASFAFATPVFVIMKSESNCPVFDNTTTIEKGSDEHRAIWQSNLCLIQGALLVACLCQVIVGFTGVTGFLMRFIGPLTIAPTISLIGLSLFETAATKAENQWWICIILHQDATEKCLRFTGKIKDSGKGTDDLFLLVMFNIIITGQAMVLLGVMVSWIICLILTETNVLSDKPGDWGYLARTDVNSASLKGSPWFRLPYPGQWGTPRFTLSAIMGMLAAVIASIIESVGDYYACARLSGAPPPPSSAVNRGIGMEGITCLLSGFWGTGGGNTSYSENIGAIGITKVGSRIVIQIAGFLMILLGCFGKFGALFVTLPGPIVAGLFFVMFGMVTAVGISHLQFVDLNSPRNLFIFGFSTFFGISLPAWLLKHEDAIDTGNKTADDVLRVLGGTSMLVGGVVALFLDNTVPGTKEERGLLFDNFNEMESANVDQSVYDLPLIQPYLDRFNILRYIPFCPKFIGDKMKPNQDNQMYKIARDDAESVDM